MKPRPFYRWKSFWLGLCVLVFSGWAWWDCGRNSTFATLQRAGEYHEICRTGRATTIIYKATGFRLATSADLAPAMKWHGRFKVRRIDIPDFGEASKSLTGWSVRVPDVTVFFSFVGLWSAWLFWHWKREQKKLSS